MLGQTKEMSSQQSHGFLYHFMQKWFHLAAACRVLHLATRQQTSPQGWLFLQLPLPTLQHPTSLVLLTRHHDLFPCSAVALQGHLQQEKGEGLNMFRQ